MMARCISHFLVKSVFRFRATSGAEAVYADTDSSDSHEEASRALGNLAGVTVLKAPLRLRSVSLNEEMQAFEREDIEPERPAGGAGSGRNRRHRSSDGSPRGRGRGRQAGERHDEGYRLLHGRLPGPEDRGAGRTGTTGGWSSAFAYGRSGSGTACSRPRNWWHRPMGHPASGPPARRCSPDGK